ncbi:MAG: hypothetical protein HC850_10305 [Rhodomicrobium sp.]|nr:hypothetical protein [Rhodomicrobium sp.]
MIKHKNIIHGLIKILNDVEADWADRDDAATELGNYDDFDGLNALIKVGSRKKEDDTLKETCGESIAQIWLRQKTIDIDALQSLDSITKQQVIALLQTHNPNLIKDYDP